MAETLEMPDAKSNGIDPNSFLTFVREIASSKRAVDEHQGVYRNARKRLKDAGTDMAAFAFVEKLNKLDDDERAVFLRAIWKYATWMDVELPAQGELFSATDDQVPTDKAKAEWSEQRVRDDGYHAGRDAEALDGNPHQVGTPNHALWAKGWHEGQAANAPALAEAEEKGIKKASTRRTREKPAPVAAGTPVH